jgi:WD40 repeat protein
MDPAGERVVCVADNGTLAARNWDGKGGSPPTSRQASHLALGPDGRWVATLGPGWGALICERESGRELLALPQEEAPVWSLAWSPDGTRLALGLPDGGLVIWNLEQVRARLAEFGIAVPSTRTGSR